MPALTPFRQHATATCGTRIHRRLHGLVAALALGLPIPGSASTAAAAVAPLPQTLEATGLYRPGTQEIDPEHLAFTPQYPLWSDGASKRRWLALPAGHAIDATRPDAWDFPPGTRLWKEFAHGRAVETRYIERLPDGAWRYATYIWQDDGHEARLAPANGATLTVDAAPHGRYRVPGQVDCRACHEGAATPVLGVGTLQLSADRDPGAPHAETDVSPVDLRELVRRGWLRGLPGHLLDKPPRIAAPTAAERSALGYLHANCGHCHNDTGAPAPVKLVLAQRTGSDPDHGRDRVLQSLIDRPGRFRPDPSDQAAPLIRPGNAAASVLMQRLSTRNPQQRMPPIGTTEPDMAAIALIGHWIDHHLSTRKETTP